MAGKEKVTADLGDKVTKAMLKNSKEVGDVATVASLKDKKRTVPLDGEVGPVATAAVAFKGKRSGVTTARTERVQGTGGGGGVATATLKRGKRHAETVGRGSTAARGPAGGHTGQREFSYVFHLRFIHEKYSYTELISKR